MFSPQVQTQAAGVLDAARAQGLRLVTAESCTGGLIAAALTDIAGSSDVVEGGFVAYANEAKVRQLGVAPRLIAEHGAVSPDVAVAMAEGALAHSGADLSVAVTGVAGPGGGTADKPVGLVYLAVARRGGSAVVTERRFGDLGRAGVRQATVKTALDLLAVALAG